MKDWLKLKKYTHFSPQFEHKHIPFIRGYVSNPINIVKHRFFPFIHYTIKERKFRRQTKFGVRQTHRDLKIKKREINYADHMDAQIFAYFSHLIGERLEAHYSDLAALGKSVIAYRAIPFNNNRNKCNIDYAHEVFEFIKTSKQLSLGAVCFDIKSFFDSLDHKILKKSWCNILGEKSLPEDHYKVYRSITMFSYVEITDLIKEFEELKIKKLQYLPFKNIHSFCKSGTEFRARVKDKGLIKYNRYDLKNKNIRDCGIPQGSPISAMLSNLYMLDFDKEMNNLVNKIGGIYRRYSDDILVICPTDQIQTIKDEVKSSITTLKLIIQDEKTQEVIFTRSSIGEDWQCISFEDGNRCPENHLSYLGFNFDGRKVLLRPKSLSLYYRQTKRMIRRKAHFAKSALKHNKYKPKDAKERDPWIYRSRIYQSKSHLGARKKKVNGKVFWGNYISYVNTASSTMCQPSLKRQLRNHWRIIEREIAYFEHLYDLTKTPSRRKKNISDKS